ncbi:MAG: hypothetical protein AMS18_09090 [Gemmatimonas sp. SG8_17]|nr:MAG: hypothetical protein AMS18_09090 [Gemmatimonas sp. SG8_17]
MVNPTRYRNVIAVIVVLSLIVLGLYLNARAGNRQEGAMAVLQCIDLYSNAATAAESTAVDAVRPIQRLTEETSCGMLRVEGHLER